MSEITDNSIITGLTKIGLSQKEATVYSSLLSLGESGGSRIERASGLHRQVVYDSLYALEEKGFVISRKERGRKRWLASSPRTVLTFIEEKENVAKKLVPALSLLLPKGSGQEFEIIQGASSFRERQLDIIKKAEPESVIRMISGMWEKYFETIGERAFDEYERIRRRKKIAIRFIGPKGTKDQLLKAEEERFFVEHKYVEGLESGLVNTIIYDEYVDFEIYGSPHITFSIKNKDVAESQKLFFESLWNMAT